MKAKKLKKILIKVFYRKEVGQGCHKKRNMEIYWGVTMASHWLSCTFPIGWTCCWAKRKIILPLQGGRVRHFLFVDAKSRLFLFGLVG